MESVKLFFIDSYKSNKIAFYIEMVSTLSVILGSLILTLTVLNPLTTVFVPFYWIGSALGLIAAILRKLSWTVILTTWFTAMNTIAMCKIFIL
jgi:hypothetical protein|tara:strand:- start:242 stop:520 length:279 start_codon:yes stop_codon:yes gene_type:complete